MKRFVLVAAALGGLVAAGAAIATLKQADVAAVSATLAATTPTNVHTRTYTCDGQTIEVTTGRWSGTAVSSTPDLNGAAELRLRSVYNTTKKLGWIDGALRIRGGDDRTSARISGINTDGKIDAWLRGRAGRGDGVLFGSLAGTFTRTGGLTGGAIGSGTATNAAVIASRIRCDGQQSPRPSVFLIVRGQIEALSATSITVKPRDGSASQTCTVRDDDDVERVRTGDQVEMSCSQLAGVWTLTKIRKK